jgi:recombinational DNA repair ATPase RecF
VPKDEFVSTATGVVSGLLQDATTRLAKAGYLRRGSNDKLISLRAGRLKSSAFDDVRVITDELSKREIRQYINLSTLDQAKRVGESIAFAIWASALGRPERQTAAKRVVRVFLLYCDTRSTFLRNFVQSIPQKASMSISKADASQLGLQLPMVELMIQLLRARTSLMIDQIAASVSPDPFDIAEVMDALGGVTAFSGSTMPTYEQGGSACRIEHVSVTGFRGATFEVEVDFCRNGKAVSAFIWGDNGAGKSTIVDGIEFALQGRVDRSADFSSASRVRVANLSSTVTRTKVRLSNGIEIDRALQDGALEDDAGEVPVGFRVAPVVLRRSDIVRFQESQTLARGSIFFDYFPADERVAEIRPDDRIRMLEERQFALRLHRDHLAQLLSSSLSVPASRLAESTQFERWFENEYGHAIRSDLGFQFDRFDEDTRMRLAGLRQVHLDLRSVKNAIERGVDKLNPVAYQEQRARLATVLETVSARLTQAFLKITRVEHLKALNVLMGVSGPISLDTVVEFHNGQKALPSQVFSEGYRDLIALLLFVEMSATAAELGQARVLVLDDVVQSVDATIRLDFFAFLLDRLPDWQLIVVGHDRAWREQLRALFNQKGAPFVEVGVSGWSFDRGMNVAAVNVDHSRMLQAALESGEVRAIAASAGLLLEQICSELSWRLRTSVIRREGDRYTLADTWSGVEKRLKSTELKEIVLSIGLRLHTRNFLGAHYNAWADSISEIDTLVFGRDVKSFYESVFCPSCMNWVSGERGGPLTCRCGVRDIH